MRKTPKALGISMDGLEETSFLDKAVSKVKHFIFQPIMFTFDAACLEVMIDILKYYLKSFDCSNCEIYVCIIGHPKALNEVSLEQISKFCAKVVNDYSDRVRFIRLRDIPL